ncbi:enoyl-CoA hydratase-related protein [Seohaeicola zhoushanensis]
MTFETIRYEIVDGVARICLNRPEHRNTMNVPMMRDILSALDLADTDDAVRVILFHGAGRMFCAGADLSAGAKPSTMTAVPAAAPVRCVRMEALTMLTPRSATGQV